VVALWRADRKLLLFSLLLFASCVVYAINYDIHDIDSYFLLAYIVIAFWAGFGILLLSGWLSARYRPGIRVMILAVAVLCAVPVVIHSPRMDRSKDHVVEDYVLNMFSLLEPNSLVLSYQWDYWVSPALYVQRVKGYRADVLIVDKELLRRSWYIEQVRGCAPWLIEESLPEVEAFLVEVKKFENGLPYDPAVIERRYAGMIGGFLRRSLPHRPVYVTPEIEEQYTVGLQRVPWGLARRLFADTLIHSSPFPEFHYRPLPGLSDYEIHLRRFYASAYLARADYYRGKDRAEVERSISAALSHDPRIFQTGSGAGRPF
jgi:hypothetical protein